MNLRWRHPRGPVSLSLALLACACAGAPRPPSAADVLSSAGPYSDGSSRDRLLALLASEPEPAAASSAVAVFTDALSSGLRAEQLGDGRRLWTTAEQADLRPVVSGDLVLYTRARALVGRDLLRGDIRLQAQLPPGEPIGIAANRHHVYVVMRETTGPLAYHLLAYDRGSGGLTFDDPVAGAMGVPVATEQVVLLPLFGQTVKALDATTGATIAQLTVADEVWSWVQVQHGALWVGDEVPRQLNAGFDGTRTSMPMQPMPLGSLDGTYLPYPSAFIPVPAGRSAHGRIGVYADLRPGPGGAPSLGEGGIYFTFYNHLYGLSERGALRFARVLPFEVINAEVVGGDLVLASADGSVARIDPTGASTPVLPATGAALSAVLALPESALNAAAPQTPSADPAPPLLVTLRAMALDRDGRLLRSRSMAVRFLAEQDGPLVTETLMELALASATPDSLRVSAERALLGRSDGPAAILAALATRYDFIAAPTPPPLHVLAPLAATLGIAEAAGPLADHLLTYSTPARDLPIVAEALSTLDPELAGRTLSTLLSRHRASEAFADGSGVFLQLVHLWLRLQPEQARAAIVSWAQSSQTTASLHAVLQSRPVTLTLEDEPVPEGAAAEAEPEQRLSRDLVAAVLRQHQDELSPCFEELKVRLPELRSARILMVVEPDGRSRARNYLPDDEAFNACLEGRLAPLKFPHASPTRLIARFTVNMDRPVEVADVASEENEQPWWQPYIRDTSAAEPLPYPPWWEDKNPVVISIAASYQRGEVGAPDPAALTPSYKDAGDVQRGRPAPATSSATAAGEEDAPAAPTSPSIPEPASPPSSPTEPTEESPWWAPVTE